MRAAAATVVGLALVLLGVQAALDAERFLDLLECGYRVGYGQPAAFDGCMSSLR